MLKRVFVLIAGLALLLAGCGSGGDNEGGNEAPEEKKEINIGFGVGTYEDMVRNGIVPILEEKGYDVKITTFSQNMQVNPAMKEEAIDASVFQSTAYMEGINEELDMNMIGIAFVPSAPQGLYSVKHDSVEDVKDGMIVALPNDPVNQERAVRILEELGWVKVKEDAGTTDFNINSVEKGDYDIEFKILDPAQILVSLQDVDFGVVNGNYIASAKDWKITDAVKIENTPKQHRIIVSILEKDKDTQWAKDLKEAFESPEFEEYILGQEKYEGFIMPEAWENN